MLCNMSISIQIFCYPSTASFCSALVTRKVLQDSLSYFETWKSRKLSKLKQPVEKQFCISVLIKIKCILFILYSFSRGPMKNRTCVFYFVLFLQWPDEISAHLGGPNVVHVGKISPNLRKSRTNWSNLRPRLSEISQGPLIKGRNLHLVNAL